MSYEKLSERWKKEGAAYAKAANDHQAIGLNEGWEIAGELDAEDTRTDMAQEVYGLLKKANKEGTLEQFRQDFPPAWDPFLPIMEENSVYISGLLALPDSRIVIRVGARDEPHTTYVIDRDTVKTDKSAEAFGASPNGSIIAKVSDGVITLHSSWDSQPIGAMSWPRAGVVFYGIYEIDSLPVITTLIPFNDGRRVLLVSEKGIFVMTADKVDLLHPSETDLKEDLEEWEEQDEPYSYCLTMEHGAVSGDDSYICIGSQDSSHMVVDSRNYSQVADIGPHSEYPHYAIFSDDGKQVALNACHFYFGVTIGVPLDDIMGLDTEAYELVDPVVVLEDDSRVYAGVSIDDLYIIGDAYGHIRAFDTKGAQRWQRFLGSTILHMALSKDKKRLMVASYSGMLHVLELDEEVEDPYTIGTAKHKELVRWIFWKGQDAPLRW